MVNTSPFEIDSEWEAPDARLTLTGELDLATVPRVTEAVEAILARDAGRVTIDLSGVSFMDSSGLRLLIVLASSASAEGWTLALTRPTQQVLTLLRISGAAENLPFIEGRG